MAHYRRFAIMKVSKPCIATLAQGSTLHYLGRLSSLLGGLNQLNPQRMAGRDRSRSFHTRWNALVADRDNEQLFEAAIESRAKRMERKNKKYISPFSI